MRTLMREFDVPPRRLVWNALSSIPPHFGLSWMRTALLRAAGMRIGAGSLVMGPIHVTGPTARADFFSIGERTFISGPLNVDLGAPVRIGSGIQLGHRVSLMTVDHEIGSREFRCGNLVAAPIVIEDGVWIAADVTVLPGVTIGTGSVVAAGAIVTRNVAPNTLVAGVPARRVRDLDDR